MHSALKACASMASLIDLDLVLASNQMQLFEIEILKEQPKPI